MNRRPGMLVSRSLQLGSPRPGNLCQRIGVVSRHSSSDKTRRRGHIHNVARLEVAQHRTYAGDQQRLLADRDCLRGPLVDDDLAARWCHMRNPQTTRGRTLLGRLKPRSHALADKHRRERVCTRKLHTDTAGARQHRGLHLRRHTASAHP